MTLGPLATAVATATQEAMAVVPRMWAHDHTVWQEDPTELADRLGWLDAAGRAASMIDDLRRIAAEVVADGITDVLLVGMGGSSLYPEVLATTFGPTGDAPRLHVLDSTDPLAVLAAERGMPWETTVVIPASKSGNTIEMVCLLERFHARIVEARGADGAGRGLIAITDPGSGLEARATAEGFRAVAHGQPDVGGRFSALTAFGLLPAALLGMDLDAHLAPAAAILEVSRSTDPQINEPAVLGAILAAAHRAGRDKLTLLLPAEVATLGNWIEQLVAESTGKHGAGILPVLGEGPDNATLGDDRLVVALGERPELEAIVAAGVPVVQLSYGGPDDIAAEVARWEVATAVAGALLAINPFDQPDVQSAKTATSEVLEAGQDLPPVEDPDGVLATVSPGDYVALLGFVTPNGDDERRLRAAADRLRARTGVPVTVGIGPRYLHSTGQLHKGGPDRGVFLVTVGDDPEDAAIPGRDYGFSRLKRAQAAGDLAALRAAGRRTAHIEIAALDRL